MPLENVQNPHGYRIFGTSRTKAENPHGYGILQNVQKDETRAAETKNRVCRLSTNPILSHTNPHGYDILPNYERPKPPMKHQRLISVIAAIMLTMYLQKQGKEVVFDALEKIPDLKDVFDG